MANGLGVTIAVLMILGFIPFLGIILMLVVSFILLPIMLYKSISASAKLPLLVGRSRITDNSILNSSCEKKPLETRNVFDLFQGEGIGYNYQIPLLTIAAQIIIFVIFGAIAYKKYFDLRMFFVFEVIATIGALFTFINMLVLYKAKNIHVTAILYGLASFIGSFIVFTIKDIAAYTSKEPFFEFLFQKFHTAELVGSLFYGVLFIYILYFAIRWWKLKYASVLFAFTLVNLLPAVLYIIHPYKNDFLYAPIFSSISSVFLLSLAFYLGIRLNVNKSRSIC
jgi:hypothetical protein